MIHPRTLALLAGSLTLALAAASLALIATDPGLLLLPPDWGVAGFDAAFAIVFAAVGLLVTTRRPGNLVGWLLLLAGLLSGIQTITASYADHASALGAAPYGALAAWITGWIWIPAVGVIALTLLVFPNGRPASPGWAAVIVALIPVTAVVTVLWAVATPGAPEHPLRELAGLSTLLLAAGFLAAAVSLGARMRRGGAVERQQIKWIAYAAALVGPALGLSIVTTLGSTDFAVAKATQVLAIVTVLFIPIAAAIAILRYRLYDIDLLINRTLVYGALTATLGAAYVGSVLLLQTVLRPFTADNEIAVAVSTLAVVALFQPLRRRIQGAVDRRFYRSRYDAARTLDAFAERLRDEVDLDQLRSELAGVVAETMRPRYVGVWLREQRR
ncbi:MAG: hypothetical protein ACRDGE_12005 [Candidatus Limnocylindria bacterium]